MHRAGAARLVVRPSTRLHPGAGAFGFVADCAPFIGSKQEHKKIEQ
jgi:hypothetical protein